MARGRRGIFITLEGPEGSGKTTQTRMLCDFLRARGLRVVHTREPGGTGIAEAVRGILLKPSNHVDPMTELLLYEAARAQHIAEVIRPALRQGRCVVCERFTDATEAYQGFGRGLPLEQVRALNRIATGGLEPDLTLFLDAPVEDGLARAQARSRGGDRLEREPLSFHRKVRRGYIALARRYRRRIRLIPWADGAETVRRRVAAEVVRFLEAAG